jgi:urease accessory protein
MKPSPSTLLRAGGIVALALVSGAAQAHTGHGTTGLFEGLAHPLGLDHLLAMVAVGLWSVSALPAHKTWWGPAIFMASLMVSAALGAAGLSVPYLEHMISLSVVLFGTMLVLHRQTMPTALGLGVVALAAALHGLAHGAETPASGFASYAAGFLLATAGLHFGGVVAGLTIRRYVAANAPLVVAGFGALCGGAGLYLFAQL